ncbi:MAG: ribose 5-phosphate isomerase B [Candidatus Omnitrophica bacterium]|nr:ribose 5-phosphate isomerase B [Candidatus Omnitrophota bacterium]
MNKIAIGCDHGGFGLKEFLKNYLTEKGYKVEDFGTYSAVSCDYPLIGHSLARAVSRGKFRKGILICKTGIGMAIIANKLKGVRSGVCNNLKQASSSRLHNDTNVLSLAAKYVTQNNAKKIVSVWLKTRALKGRHGKRVGQIKKLELR